MASRLGPITAAFAATIAAFASTLLAQEPIATLRCDGMVVSTAFSPDMSRVATASLDNKVRLWEPTTGKLVAAMELRFKPFVVEFSPDATLVAAGDEGGYATLWETATGKVYEDFQHHDPITSIAFSPDGTRFATGSRDNSAALWDIKKKAHIANLLCKNDVMSVVFSPDGAKIATASKDTTIRLWNANTGKIQSTMFHSSDAWTVGFSPDGTRLISGASDNTARIWDTATGKLVTLLNHKADVRAVAFSPSGFIVATGSDDGMVRLWDARTGELLRMLQYADAVTSVAFSPDGLIVATGSRDDRSFLWDIEGEQLLATLEHTKDVVDVAFSADGLLVATASEDWTAAIWSLLPPPVAPQLVSPNEDVVLNAVSARGMFLRWEELASAWGYHVQVSDNPTFLSLVIDTYSSRAEYQMPLGKIGNGTYYWRVASSTVRDYLGPWSKTRSFSVDAANVVRADVVFTDQTTAIAEVRAERMSDLFGFQATLTFDPTVLQVEEVTEGGFLKSAGGSTNWQTPVIENKIGSVTLLLYRLSEGVANGNGLLATIRFKVIKDGVSVVGFSRLKLSDDKGSAVLGIPVEDTVTAAGPATLTVFVEPRVVNNALVVDVRVDRADNVANFEMKLPYPLAMLELLEGTPNIRGEGSPAPGVVMVLRFRIWDGGDLVLRPSGVVRSPKGEKGRLLVVEGQIHLTPSPPVDVNKDYRIDSADLVVLGRNFDTQVIGTVRPNPDVNGDGIVDLFDFVAVAVAFGETYSATTGAPQAFASQRAAPESAASDRSLWRGILGELDRRGLRGGDFDTTRRLLRELLAFGEAPERAQLLANYPNPFNPETWIPFELSETTEVVVTIYDVVGRQIRRFELGALPVGRYESRFRAVYWDGRNADGEPAASGIYYAALDAGASRHLRRLTIAR